MSMFKRLSRWWRQQDLPLVRRETDASVNARLADTRRRLGWRDGKPPAGASVYMAKCKRLRADGPTPCFCCQGECYGDLYETSL